MYRDSIFFTSCNKWFKVHVHLWCTLLLCFRLFLSLSRSYLGFTFYGGNPESVYQQHSLQDQCWQALRFPTLQFQIKRNILLMQRNKARNSQRRWVGTSHLVSERNPHRLGSNWEPKLTNPCIRSGNDLHTPCHQEIAIARTHSCILKMLRKSKFASGVIRRGKWNLIKPRLQESVARDFIPQVTFP